MERLFQIKLKNKVYRGLYEIFQPSKNIPDHFEKYYVKIPLLISSPRGFYSETEGNGVYNSDHQLIGDIITSEFEDCTLITFYLRNNEQRQALLEFIKLKIDDMKFAGFTILATREFSEDSVSVEFEKRPYIPKRKASLDKWKASYKIIRNMQDEQLNSDDLEIYINKLADFRDRIKSDLGIQYTERTLSDIKRAGEAGLLD